MSYNYTRERLKLFTEDGVAKVIEVRDAAISILNLAGAARSDRLMVGTGDSWMMMAAMDFLVERGELVRITPKGSTAGQDEIFVAGPNLKGVDR